MGKFMVKVTMSGESFVKEITHNELCMFAFEKFGGGYTAEQTAGAMLYVREVMRKARKDNPHVLREDGPDKYIEVYYEEVK